MKFFALFLFATVLAATSAKIILPVHENSERDIIQCITDAVEDLNAKVAALQEAIGGFSEDLANAQAKGDKCLAIGGDKPSIIDQINQGRCLIGVYKDLANDLANTVADVNKAINDVLVATGNISKCL